jgi:ABC-type arginine transport system ATPase subunit
MENHRAIQVQGLYKHFGEIQAVQDISFEVAQSEIFSLFGPNGAGKSTIISMLSCLLQPNAGDAQVMGQRSGANRWPSGRPSALCPRRLLSTATCQPARIWPSGARVRDTRLRPGQQVRTAVPERCQEHGYSGAKDTSSSTEGRLHHAYSRATYLH